MPFDIAAQIERWQAQLLDTSKRSRLIIFNTGRSSGIKLAYPDPAKVWSTLAEGGRLTFPWRRALLEESEAAPSAESAGDPDTDEDERVKDASSREELAACLDSPNLAGDHVLTELTDRLLARRLGRMALAARTSIAEQGVATLHLAFGFLRWYESADSAVEVLSPLLLVPARLDRESVEAPWYLSLEEDEVAANHSLAQLVLNDFALHLPLPPEDASGLPHRYE